MEAGRALTHDHLTLARVLDSLLKLIMDNPGGSKVLGGRVCALVGQDEEGVREGRDGPGIPGQLCHLVDMMRSLRNSQH